MATGSPRTRDQNPDGQRDAFTAARCDEILIDKASGKLARRPALDKALTAEFSGFLVPIPPRPQNTRGNQAFGVIEG